MISEKMRGYVENSSAIRAMFEEGKKMADQFGAENVYDFSLGNPNVPAPEAVKNAIIEIVNDTDPVALHGYTNSNCGYAEVRAAVAKSLNERFDTHFEGKNIVMTVGAAGGLNTILKTIINPGEEVLTFAPFFGEYRNYVSNFGGKLVAVSPDTATFQPKFDEFEKLINKNTKAVIVNNPNNPTGALYPREVLQQIVDIAREHQLMIFSDEIYDRLVMDGEEHVSIASLAPDLFCVTFSGLSKSHMIAGFRIGWMILSGNKAIARDYIEGLNMLSNMRLCSNVPAQAVVQTALGGHQSVNDYIIPGGRIYEQREFIYNALCDIPGISAVKPKAAFYIFPKIDTKKFNITNDEQFALDLLREKKILIVHGSGFNWKDPDHFRVVYLPRVEVLEDASVKLRDFLEYYRQ